MSSLFDFSSLADFFRETLPDFTTTRAQEYSLKTTRTTTVFSGTPHEWETYLTTPWAERRDHVLDTDIRLDRDRKQITFHPRNADSKPWCGWLEEGMALIQKRLEPESMALEVFHRLLFDNESNHATPLHLHATGKLPSEATREVRFNDQLRPLETDIVLRASMLENVAEHRRSLDKKASDLRKLGVLWPVLRRVISQLGYPSYPRDRFKDRITLTTRVSFLSIQLLFDGKTKGMLEPNEAGDLYMDYISKRDGIKKKYLFYHQSYFRMLNDLSFLTKEKNYDAFWDASQVIVRDFLDERYLRISVAGVMPGLLEWMAPMEYERKKKKKVNTPSPQKGLYGILDKEDLKAWKKVQEPLKDVGFVLLRQLGIGQFGRVYEALNLKNSSIPQHVAIKVDRIRKGKKKEAIQAVETIMDISRGLSQCPHVIRVHDAGRLKEIKSTYHILQLVNGDTLDNLIGVTGTEHASVYRPPFARACERDLRREYLKVINSTAGERWRKDRASLPFTDPLSLSQFLDVMTSTLLWLEECHNLNFAINDLKNGNLMISRRGQLKGIDLDTYSPVSGPLDKLPDFFFLAVTLLLFILRVLTAGHDENIKAGGLLGHPAELNRLLCEIWRFGDLAKITGGRVESNQIIGWILHTIENSRSGAFAHEPEMFTQSIDALIRLKRNLVNEEMVLD